MNLAELFEEQRVPFHSGYRSHCPLIERLAQDRKEFSSSLGYGLPPSTQAASRSGWIALRIKRTRPVAQSGALDSEASHLLVSVFLSFPTHLLCSELHISQYCYLWCDHCLSQLLFLWAILILNTLPKHSVNCDDDDDNYHFLSAFYKHIINSIREYNCFLIHLQKRSK